MADRDGAVKEPGPAGETRHARHVAVTRAGGRRLALCRISPGKIPECHVPERPMIPIRPESVFLRDDGPERARSLGYFASVASVPTPSGGNTQPRARSGPSSTLRFHRPLAASLSLECGVPSVWAVNARKLLQGIAMQQSCGIHHLRFVCFYLCVDCISSRRFSGVT